VLPVRQTRCGALCGAEVWGVRGQYRAYTDWGLM